MRSILIGIDGAEPRLIEKWIDELPNLQKFYNCFGKLESTLPPSSAPAWTSIVTGTPPSSHGIYDFFYFDGEIKLISSTCRRTPALWNLLSSIGKRSIVINVPVTYPPERVHGIIVSGLLTPPNENFVEPKEAKKYLEGYKMEHLIIDDLPIRILAHYKPEKVMSILNEWISSRSMAAINLMKNFSWDFCMLVYRASDLVQHFLWNRKDYVFQIYKRIDEEIGKLMKKFNANYFIVSDHGFYGIKRNICLNNLLYEQGYLKAKGKESGLTFGKKVTKLLSFLPKNFTHLPFMRKILLSIAFKKNSIDFASSKAFCLSSSSRAIIARDEVKKEILLKLNNFTYDGKNPMKAYEAEKIYGKDERQPDILIELEEGYAILDMLNFGDIIQKPTAFHFKGEHSKYGIFMAYGENFKEWEGEIKAVDVLPNIFHSMNLPVPKHVEGEVANIFKGRRKVKKVDWQRYGISNREINLIRKIAKTQKQ